MTFDTPPPEGPFGGYSTLADVGVVIIKKVAFQAAVLRIDTRDVFSRLLSHLPPDNNRINAVTASDPYQFLNVNSRRDSPVTGRA